MYATWTVLWTEMDVKFGNQVCFNNILFTIYTWYIFYIYNLTNEDLSSTTFNLKKHHNNPEHL